MTNDQLVLRIRAGEDAAGNMLQLWQQNQGIISKLAGKHKSMAEEEDLKQEGFLGLCEAVQRWEPDGGASFVSYAIFWIKQRMSRYVKGNGTIRIPEHAGNRVRAYQRMVSQWLSEFGRKPTEYEISRYLDVSLGIVRQIEKNAQMGQIQSLDMPIGEEEDSTMYDLAPGSDDPEESVLDRVQKEQLRAVVWPSVDGLPGQQPAVIRMRFQDRRTLKETGEALGVNPERARQIEANAFRELRKPSRSRQLRPFLDDQIKSMALSGNGVSSFQNTWTSSTEKAALLMEEWEEYEKELIMKKHGVYRQRSKR